MRFLAMLLLCLFVCASCLDALEGSGESPTTQAQDSISVESIPLEWQQHQVGGLDFCFQYPANLLTLQTYKAEFGVKPNPYYSVFWGSGELKDTRVTLITRTRAWDYDLQKGLEIAIQDVDPKGARYQPMYSSLDSNSYTITGRMEGDKYFYRRVWLAPLTPMECQVEYCYPPEATPLIERILAVSDSLFPHCQ